MQTEVNTEQFSCMVQQYERLVYTICYQFVKDHALAEDLTQDTFLSAYLHRNTCPAENYKPWLARIATNKAKDYLKSAYARRVSATEEDALARTPAPSGVAQPEEITVSASEAQAIADLILALKEPYALAAQMFFLQQLPVEIIAKRLDRPPKTVHTQLYRARQMLQKQIEGRARHGIV